MVLNHHMYSAYLHYKINVYMYMIFLLPSTPVKGSIAMAFIE